jgi:hypothetical protein
MIRALACVTLGLAVSLPAFSADTSFGVVTRAPDSTYQYYLVGGNQLQVAGDTQVKTSVGPFEVGACAEIDAAGGVIQEIQTRSMSYCDKTDYDAYFAQFASIATKQGN